LHLCPFACKDTKYFGIRNSEPAIISNYLLQNEKNIEKAAHLNYFS